VTEGAARRHNLEQMLSGVRHQMFLHKVPFGHELEQLSSIYVNIDDIQESGFFKADSDTVADLEELARSLAAEADEFLTPELTKKIAVLHDHVQFLKRYETDSALIERLNAVDEKLRKLLSHVLGEPTQSADGDAVEGMPHAHGASMPLSEEDERDLRFLLEAGAALTRGWAILLRWMWHRTKALGRKVRRYRF
jgi:hypothetical protein